MRAILATVVLFAATSAHAEMVYDGNALWELCQDNKPYATGYVAGWLDKYANDNGAVQVDFLKQKKRDERNDALSKDITANICLPSGFRLAQGVDTVCIFLREHPQNRHLTTMYQMTTALSEAWPCK
ncbi:Rap1a/Tai family immunity protein [Rhizobium sp. Rhizsp82]|uniref:Rap1a/Tai family immunity protein n=1 Tax=Rhizobium sp. Rhizsp82 TaxID=3243057 RepID=UPI0039B380C4